MSVVVVVSRSLSFRGMSTEDEFEKYVFCFFFVYSFFLLHYHNNNITAERNMSSFFMFSFARGGRTESVNAMEDGSILSGFMFDVRSFARSLLTRAW